MWKCPKCGREFKRDNQSHYCGEKPKTIDEYIEAQTEAQQAFLHKIREAIHQAIPDAEERISWSMPTFWKGHNIIHFAAHKKHMGIYAGTQAVIEFAEALQPYKTSKGTIQIPYEEPLPLELIAQIASWCYATEIIRKENVEHMFLMWYNIFKVFELHIC